VTVANPRALRGALALLAAAVGLLALAAPQAHADGCPTIKNKPHQVPHVKYPGMQKITYCFGPINIKPGQNVIRLNSAKNGSTKLFPQVPGYITRFDPEFVYQDGTVPRVDVVHLHHGVWIVNGSPQFAAGEEKTIVQEPKGFGWRSKPSDTWLVNDMLHELVDRPAVVYLVWRIDFVPDSAITSPNEIRTVQTKWMDVSGPQPRVGISSPIYPVFNALQGWGKHGKYVFPDEAKGDQRDLIGPSQTWTPTHPVTLIGTAGHLHPGGLYTQLEVSNGTKTNRIFRSKAHYYEPAGEVSWDVAMGGTPKNWRVKLKPGDQLSVHAAYDTRRASWYEVMGIMPVSVYDGTDVGGVGPFSKKIPQRNVLTHTHLDENRHHGGKKTDMPDPVALPNGVNPVGPIDIQDFTYTQGDLADPTKDGRPPVVKQGQSLTFLNLDSTSPSDPTDAYHTITACREPCNRSTGIAYPIANASVDFDSGELGFNSTNPTFGAPASGTNTWSTPKNLKPGTYTYFCRIHPFMRGSFRVIKN
jgi:plastocyanin